MSIVRIVLMLVLLAGCSPDIPHKTAVKIIEACDEAGMKYQIRGSQITCWMPAK
jgi:hypothetical protein